MYHQVIGRIMATQNDPHPEYDYTRLHEDGGRMGQGIQEFPEAGKGMEM